ncbi:CDP-alcohol phosphatidyltransferase family protein [Candidatus Fermentibacteria bacterium]|nr:CDP-alcohol phosphatidyltransferase family protein [Candidatus Fermentibacteria bacterium]
MEQEELRRAGRRLLEPAVGLLARMGIAPSAVTLAGLAVTGLASWLVCRGEWLAGAAILAAGSVLDALDGGVARKRGMVSRAGAVLDSTCDRVGELLVFTALMAGEAGRTLPVLIWLGPAALGGSFMVSYTRARAEGAGIACSSGLMTRTERLILLVASLVAAGVIGSAEPIEWMLIVVAAGAWLTAVSRLVRVFREDRLTGGYGQRA